MPRIGFIASRLLSRTSFLVNRVALRDHAFWAVVRFDGHTYIPMARGFVYLAVVLDRFSRVLSWRVSITMEAAFCVETLEDALARRAASSPARPSRAC